MTPSTEAELAEILRDARAPIHVHGGGTRAIGRLSGPTQELRTWNLNGITLYEPGALTVVVQAGTPLPDLEAALDAESQRLAFEPVDYRGLLGTTGLPTVGGMVAANASGPRRIQTGACRDHLLGVRFVDGAGTIVKNGGRVMKNVTGYDLVKLMAGSWGTLGVLTEVSLKVLPKPDAMASIEITGLEDAQAVQAMAAGLGSPFDVTGAAHLPDGPEGASVTLLRIEGFTQSVAYRAQQLRSLAERFGPVRVETDKQAVAARWAAVRDVAVFHAQPGDVWRLSVKPSDAPALVARAGAEGAMFDWGGGLVWLRMTPGTDLRARLGAFAGHATLVRGDDATRAKLAAFHPEPAPIARISRGLRERFDPRGLLNPGLMAA